MIEIKDLLLNINNVLLKEELKKETIRDVLSKALKIEIKSEDIQLKNNVIYLNTKPIYKNEILIKKDFINKKIKEHLGALSPDSFR